MLWQQSHRPPGFFFGTLPSAYIERDVISGGALNESQKFPKSLDSE
jgi:hypothetical protein